MRRDKISTRSIL